MPTVNRQHDPPFDGAYTRTFDPGPDGDRASEAVIAAVSAVTGAQPASLSPLYDAVEPDGLDVLVAHAQRTPDPPRSRLAFEYEGYDVTVRGDGVVALETVPDTGHSADVATAADSE